MSKYKFFSSIYNQMVYTSYYYLRQLPQRLGAGYPGSVEELGRHDWQKMAATTS